MPEQAPSPDDSRASRDVEEDVVEATSAESLPERFRNLRLWADHLEARLAKKTEQADTWRHRAEERNRRISELEASVRRTNRPRLRSLLKRSSRSGNPATEDTSALSQPPPQDGARVVPNERRLDTPRSRLIHPTIRLGVAAPHPVVVPPLLGRMNATIIRDPSRANEIRAVDLLVTVGLEGERLASSTEAIIQWMEDGNPTIAVDSPLRGPTNVDVAKLAYFDEEEDIFGLGTAPHRSDLDPYLQPTLYSLNQAQPSRGLAQIKEALDAESPLDQQEKRAVGLLRQLREESSARAVGERFLLASGVTVPRWRREALVALVSKRPDFVIAATERMIEQTYRPLRIAIGLHGPAAEAEREVRQHLVERELPHVVIRFDPSMPQGACLNALVEKSPGDVILKIDDDDWYSPVFISDMMGALEFSGAAIVGKAAAFVRLRDGRFVLLRPRSYQEVDHVVGPTITAHRWAWEEVRFPHRHERVDSKFLQAARTQGLRVVSHHPWDFCVIRHDRGHSWTASDDYFLSSGRPVDIDWNRICTG
jgi:hypothetical protein